MCIGSIPEGGPIVDELATVTRYYLFPKQSELPPGEKYISTASGKPTCASFSGNVTGLPANKFTTSWSSSLVK